MIRATWCPCHEGAVHSAPTRTKVMSRKHRTDHRDVFWEPHGDPVIKEQSTVHQHWLRLYPESTARITEIVMLRTTWWPCHKGAVHCAPARTKDISRKHRADHRDSNAENTWWPCHKGAVHCPPARTKAISRKHRADHRDSDAENHLVTLSQRSSPLCINTGQGSVQKALRISHLLPVIKKQSTVYHHGLRLYPESTARITEIVMTRTTWWPCHKGAVHCAPTRAKVISRKHRADHRDSNDKNHLVTLS